MQISISSFILSVFFISFIHSGSSAQDTIKDSSTGQVFSKEVTFNFQGQEYRLEATGVATRKKFIVKVYSVAHYIQDPSSTTINEDVINDAKAKQLTLKWVRNVSAKRVQDGYRDSLQKAISSSDYSRLSSEVDQYISFFNQGARKGDEHVIRWLPGGNIEVYINGSKVGNITNTDFARGLWNVWLGQRSVVKRNDLISLFR